MSDSHSPAHVAAPPELSRPVRVEDLGLQEFTLDITPSAAELAALGARLKIDALNALDAHATVRLLANGDVLVRGMLTAHVTQTCGVTLEPVGNDIHAEFTRLYSHISEDGAGLEEEEFSGLDDDDEPPAPIVNGKIDIGEALTEQLALEIDPFPRVKGALFEGYMSGSDASPGALDETVSQKKNPFAVLAKLKETPKSPK